MHELSRVRALVRRAGLVDERALRAGLVIRAEAVGERRGERGRGEGDEGEGGAHGVRGYGDGDGSGERRSCLRLGGSRRRLEC
jgi:hypothetical protein